MHAGQYAYWLESESRAGRTSGTSTWERKPGLREGDDINFTFDAEFNPYRGDFFASQYARVCKTMSLKSFQRLAICLELSRKQQPQALVDSSLRLF